MPETWAIWIIGLLLTTIGGQWLLLWRTKHAHDDERETNWQLWRAELTRRLDKMDGRLDVVIELNTRMRRAEDDIKAIEKWIDLKGGVYAEIVPEHEKRIVSLEKWRNGRIS